jgi:hypothetical protein
MQTLEALAKLHNSHRRYVTYFILYKSIVNGSLPSTRDKENNHSVEWSDVDAYFPVVPRGTVSVSDAAKDTGMASGSVWHRIRKLNIEPLCPLKDKRHSTGMCFITKKDYNRIINY